jgi:hypothetical protein
MRRQNPGIFRCITVALESQLVGTKLSNARRLLQEEAIDPFQDVTHPVKSSTLVNLFAKKSVIRSTFSLCSSAMARSCPQRTRDTRRSRPIARQFIRLIAQGSTGTPILERDDRSWDRSRKQRPSSRPMQPLMKVPPRWAKAQRRPSPCQQSPQGRLYLTLRLLRPATNPDKLSDTGNALA